MNWMEFKITTVREAADAITEKLYELGVKGVAIEDPMDLRDICNSEVYWDYVDNNVSSEVDNKVIIKAYFPETTNYEEKLIGINQAIEDIKSFLDVGLGLVETASVNEEDWATSWMKYYKPTRVSEHIVIKPTWEEYTPKKDDVVINMDPGMAFGTGTHETTRMCMQMLDKYMKPNSKVLDVGCGTGILGITALKLHADSVCAVDIDEVAVKVSLKNASINNVEEKITIKKGNLVDVVDGKFDAVVANIIADAIILLSGSIKDYMTNDSVFISSGIIHEREAEVIETLNNNFEVIEVVHDGEWTAIVSKLRI